MSQSFLSVVLSSFVSESKREKYFGRFLALGFPMPPFHDGAHRCGFVDVLDQLNVSQATSLCGNGYHLHENLLVFLYVVGNIMMRPVEHPAVALADSSDRDEDEEFSVV